MIYIPIIYDRGTRQLIATIDPEKDIKVSYLRDDHCVCVSKGGILLMTSKVSEYYATSDFIEYCLDIERLFDHP